MKCTCCFHVYGICQRVAIRNAKMEKSALHCRCSLKLVWWHNFPGCFDEWFLAFSFCVCDLWVKGFPVLVVFLLYEMSILLTFMKICHVILQILMLIWISTAKRKRCIELTVRSFLERSVTRRCFLKKIGNCSASITGRSEYIITVNSVCTVKKGNIEQQGKYE